MAILPTYTYIPGASSVVSRTITSNITVILLCRKRSGAFVCFIFVFASPLEIWRFCLLRAGDRRKKQLLNLQLVDFTSATVYPTNQILLFRMTLIRTTALVSPENAGITVLVAIIPDTPQKTYKRANVPRAEASFPRAPQERA